MKHPNILLDPDYPSRIILGKMAKREELLKDRWFTFLKNFLISTPYFFGVVILFLFLFRLIIPDMVYSWLFVVIMSLILSSYWSDKQAVKDIQKKIEEYNKKMSADQERGEGIFKERNIFKDAAKLRNLTKKTGENQNETTEAE